MTRYNPVEIERKWRDRWDSEQSFRTDDSSDAEKYYVLEMFPYPSGRIIWAMCAIILWVT